MGMHICMHTCACTCVRMRVPVYPLHTPMRDDKCACTGYVLLRAEEVCMCLPKKSVPRHTPRCALIPVHVSRLVFRASA